MQSKIDERRTEKNGGLHGVMPLRTVKSSSQGWSTHSSAANPSVSVLLSPTIHPFTHLYLCFSDEDKGKHSLICSLLPQFPLPLLFPSLGLFRQGSQAWLAIVTWPHGGKIGKHAQTHTGVCTHTYVYAYTCTWQGGGQGQVLLGLITPWARPTDNEGAGEKGVMPFLMSAIARRTHTWKSVSDWRQKYWAVFWSSSLHTFFFFSQHVNTTKPRKLVRRRGEKGKERYVEGNAGREDKGDE